MCADDTQLYSSFDLNNSCDEIAARSRIELCINDIKMWMTVKKLNDDKTELLIMSSKYHQSKLTAKLIQLLLPTSMRRLLPVILELYLITHFPWTTTSKICVNHAISKSGTLI